MNRTYVFLHWGTDVHVFIRLCRFFFAPLFEARQRKIFPVLMALDNSSVSFPFFLLLPREGSITKMD